MPIIPTLRQSPVAAAPGAVLDRNRRPTVDTRGQQQAVGQVVRNAQVADVDARAFAAPYEALGAVGQAISRTGSVIGALAEKVDEAKTDKQVFGKDNEITSSFGEFDSWAASAPAELHVAEFEKLGASGREQLLADKSLTPKASERIAMQFDRRYAQKRAQVMEMSAKQLFRDNGNNARATINNATEAGDWTTTEASAKEAIRKGYLPAFEMPEVKRTFNAVQERKAKEAEAESFKQAQGNTVVAVRAGGFTVAEKEIRSGYLKQADPVKTERLIEMARTLQNQGEADALNKIAEQIQNNELDSVEAIDASFGKNPMVSPGARAHAVKLLEKHVADGMPKPPVFGTEEATRNFVDMRQKVVSRNAADDPTKEKYAETLVEIYQRVPQQLQGELTRELYNRYFAEPPQAAKERPEIQKNVSKTLDRIFDAKSGPYAWKITQMERNKKGVLLPVLDDNGNQVIIDDPVREQNAINERTKIEQQMNDWFRDNPSKANDVDAVQKQLNLFRSGKDDKAFLESVMPVKPMETGALDAETIQLVKGLEGFIPRAYSDYKQTSVGYGTRAKYPGESLNTAQADARLREELSMHASRIDVAAKDAGFKLTPKQRAALISFDFNTGRGAALMETSDDMDEVKRRMGLYVKAGGKKLSGLVNRRKKELEYFSS